jgi:hypothetical protein
VKLSRLRPYLAASLGGVGSSALALIGIVDSELAPVCVGIALACLGLAGGLAASNQKKRFGLLAATLAFPLAGVQADELAR